MEISEREWHLMLQALAQDTKEDEAFKKWLHLSKEHRHFYEHLKKQKQLYQTKGLFDAFEQRKDTMWAQIKQATQPTEDTTPLLSISYLAWIKRIAAILLLTGAGLIGYFQWNVKRSEEASRTFIHIVNKAGEQRKLTLPDGSTVYLDGSSSLQYPADFGNSTRTIQLNGQALFDVKAQVKAPFQVKTEGFLTEVLGTRFLINAFEKDKQQQITLLNGKIKVSNATGNQSQTLMPGQSLILHVTEGIIDGPQTIDTNRVLSFTRQQVILQNSDWEELAKVIQRNYGYQLRNESSKRTLRYSGQATTRQLGYLLSDIAFATGLSYRVQDSTIIFSNSTR